MFEPVDKNFDVPKLEHRVMQRWQDNDVEQRYLHRNDGSSERFSFLDGPITANGIMGVHHAWGRTYKDLWQRYNTMLGNKQRYQNGFDCQGLWVEVTVEKELGFTSKRDIEAYGIAEFVRKCKESVFNFADVITHQSRRLGQFMDWSDSYYTLSDENNYTIWHFLKRCHERGLIYKGTDVMPWCTRCGTGLSEHEIATDGYQDVTHTSVYVRFPLEGREREYLLVWTTTPWTLTSNVAVAVNPELTYAKVRQDDCTYYVAQGAMSSLRGDVEVLETLPGKDMLGWTYRGPFDELPAAAGVQHTVIPWEDVAADEGTGLVHIAPGCGKEDFALGKEFGLVVIAPIDAAGVYKSGFDWLTGKNVHDVAGEIVSNLQQKDLMYRPQSYTHRYPTCWRCGTELVFRLVDEWFISMDPLREPMMEVVRKIEWIPGYGLERELDWLRNMGDWMISKKRYWGLALPFWICPDGHLQVIGGRAELEERALEPIVGLESPHRPWVDSITIDCDQCEGTAHRIADVGNPWLDAGIVPYSTMKYRTDPDYFHDWFPADFITESFPGQFRNWFYSMLAMSTVLEDAEPFRSVLGYQLVRAQDGREMHKSWGNAIAFDEAADKAGADLMRWLFASHNPAININFGWEALDSVKRRLLVLWNTYSFFVTYAAIDGWTPGLERPPLQSRPVLDRWILARLHRLIVDVRSGLDAYDAVGPTKQIERFIEDLSTWYVRLSRRRFWREGNDDDKRAAHATLYECLTTLSQLVAPFMPFLADDMYHNLVAQPTGRQDQSIHLTDFPVSNPSLIDDELLAAVSLAQEVVALGRAARDRANIKVRQPLEQLFVRAATRSDENRICDMEDLILSELNVKHLRIAGPEEQFVTYTVRPNLPVLGPRFNKQLGLVRTALSDLEPDAVAARVEAGENVVLVVGDSQVTLSPEDILVSVEEREGYAAMASSGLLVALDTELSHELILEGLAREVVRRVNDWRKSAGLEIDDRIVLAYDAAGDLREAIESHEKYIKEETLAVELVFRGEGLQPQFDARLGDFDFRATIDALDRARAAPR